jgi:protease IV
MRVFYDDFVEKAAMSRRTSAGNIDAVAQGRVWTGQQARQHGLVDAIGGLDTAVSLAKQRAGIPADEDVELVLYPPRRSLYEALTDRFQSSSFNIWGQLAAGADRPALGVLTAPVRLFRRGEPLALMPYVFVR